jgi:hypothetical protein
MYNNIEVVSLEKQKDSGVARVKNFLQASELTSSPITINEYYQACKDYPILFAKNPNGTWFSLALLGLDKRNQFVDKDGFWRENCYIPEHITRYPFLFAEGENELFLTYDADHKIKKEDAQERYFFEDNGELSPFTTEVVNAMNRAQKVNLQTQNFIKALDEAGVLEPSSIGGKDTNGKDISVGGFWIVKEEKFNNLTDKKKSKLFKKGYIQPLTAHQISISNIQKLL